MNAFVVFYVLHLASLAVAQGRFSSNGMFFQQITGEAEKTEKDSTFITQEFFGCQRSETCPYLVTNMESNQKHISSEIEVKSRVENFSAIWKRHLPSGDCKDLYNGGISTSGIYDIDVPNKEGKLKVYCDMETDNGGWTVIQRRVDNTTSFNRSWVDYRNGFGDLQKNMWIGLENMYFLAGPDSHVALRVDLMHLMKGKKKFYAKYGIFKINSEADWYRLHVSEYSGTAGDSFNFGGTFRTTNNMTFSTFDRDNDFAIRSCAQLLHGAWWFNRCGSCHLNGLYPNQPTTAIEYISWSPIDSKHGNIFFTEMKIRRN